jgi:hypothetical protein
MSDTNLPSRLSVGVPLARLRECLVAGKEGGHDVTFDVTARARPFVDHVVTAFVDGPAGSNVEVVLSAAHPEGGRWLRFTISRVAPHHYEIDAFPTPFASALAPLSPGVPPVVSGGFAQAPISKG